MQHNRNNLFDVRIIISLFIIAAGIILLAENLGFDTHINIWEWWPLILIIIGIGHLVRPASNRQPFTGLILIGLGGIFLGNALDIFYFDIGDLWPIFLILVGFAMIRGHAWKVSKETLDHDSVKLSMMLGGGEYRFSSKNFKGGKVTAFMGGGTLDLTEAEMEGPEVELDVFVLMGGMELRIPKHWQLNVQATPLLGGVEDKTYASNVGSGSGDFTQSIKRLTIKGTLIMGGLEVRN